MESNELYNNKYINTDGNYIHETAIIGKNVKLGKGNVIMPYAVIGETGFIRDLDNQKGKVVIGDNNKIGCHVCIMTGEKGNTYIGSDNLIMNYANIGHDVIVRSKCEIGPAVIIGGFSFVDDEAIIKIGALIRNRIDIGKRTLIGMGSVVVKNVKDFQTVLGNPARCV